MPRELRLTFQKGDLRVSSAKQSQLRWVPRGIEGVVQGYSDCERRGTEANAYQVV